MKNRLFKYYLVVLINLIGFQSKSQLLFIQDNVKGGISADGFSYFQLSYLQVDTLHFQSNIPPLSTIKKAFLFSHRMEYLIGKNLIKDSPVTLQLNNINLIIDSSNIVTNTFHCDYSAVSGPGWVTANDVTALVVNGINTLITPCQACLMFDDTTRNYVLISYMLLIEYEDLSMPETNIAVFLNNKTFASTFSYNFSNFNPANNINNIGLSIWTNNLRSFPGNFSSDYILNSTLGSFNLGTLDMYKGGTTWSKNLPGSFDYKNNTLTGLQDDTPDAFIDSTDALANIQSYLPNNATTFTITTSGNVTPACANERLGFFLAYTSPCPASTSKDTSITICRGQSVNLNASPGFTNYSWYPLAGLNDSTIANPTATPQHSTNYITYIKDAAGCMHTEHTQIIVHGQPVPDSLQITNAICGTSEGSLLITSNYHNYGPYQYNIGSGNTTDTSFSNLTAGNYTLSVTDGIGCTYQSPFSVTESNPAIANFSTLGSTINPAPLFVVFSNSSTGANTYNWYFPTDTLHTFNTSYNFTESGTYTITLIAYNNLPQCSDTATAVITVLPEDTSGIFVPNVFSPNGDGLNDVFEVRMKNVELETFEIFDRWGLSIFKSGEMSMKYYQTATWDGRTTAGMQCSEGTYFYVIRIKDRDAVVKEYKGFISLVR
jgi:gliding motility-associated-like protein